MDGILALKKNEKIFEEFLICRTMQTGIYYLAEHMEIHSIYESLFLLENKSKLCF